jgi:hypothetical protein
MAVSKKVSSPETRHFQGNKMLVSEGDICGRNSNSSSYVTGVFNIFVLNCLILKV